MIVICEVLRMTNTFCKPLGQLFSSKVDTEMKFFSGKRLGDNNEPNRSYIYKLTTPEKKKNSTKV